MKTLDQQMERLIELRDEAAVTVGMIAEVRSKVSLYMQNPELIEEHFDEEKMRNDLNRYSQHLKDLQRELNEIDGQIQELAGVNGT